MDAKLLLVKAITLLYRESQCDDNGSGSEQLIKGVIANIQIPETVSELSNNVLAELKDTLQDMLNAPTDRKFEKDDLMQRIRVNTGDDDYLYDALAVGIEKDLEHEALVKLCGNLRYELKISQNRSALKKALKEAYTQTTFRENEVNWASFVPELLNQLEGLNDAGGSTRSAALVGSLNLSDKLAVKQLLLDGKDSVCGDGIMRTGWQGFNELTDGGLRRGELVIIGALRHNFKSGMLLHLPSQIARYNIPYMIDPKKKPLIVHISLENELKTNIIALYANLWELKHGTKCDITEITEEKLIEAAEFIDREMSVNGYEFKMLRYNPSDFTHNDLFDELRQLESENYEIHLLSTDYLAMMSVAGCSGGTNADQIRDLYRRCRNFCAPRQITLLTAHQLSTDATMKLRDGSTNFVQEVAGKSYYANCKSVDHEADLEVTIHIEKPGDGFSYLTMARGKHRKPTITPESHQYQVYRFEEVGTIPDDIQGVSNARKSVGGGTASEGGGAAWYDV